MTDSTDYISCMVRLWREESRHGSSAARPDWHSEIKHFQSGQRWTFRTLDELLAFVQALAETLTAVDRPSGDEFWPACPPE